MVSQQKCGANDIDLKNPAILSTDCTNRHTNWMKLYQLHQKSHHSHWFPSVWDGRVHLLLNLWPTSGKTKPTSLTCSSVESMQQKKSATDGNGSWPKCNAQKDLQGKKVKSTRVFRDISRLSSIRSSNRAKTTAQPARDCLVFCGSWKVKLLIQRWRRWQKLGETEIAPVRVSPEEPTTGQL